MSKITLSKIDHRDETRIKAVFEKKANLIAKIRSISGRRWSATKNCWHLPYTSESFEALKSVFGEDQLVYVKEENHLTFTVEKLLVSEKNSTRFQPQFIEYQKDGVSKNKVIGEQILVKKRDTKSIEAYVPFDKKGWVEVVRNIEGREWDVKKTAWLLPNVKATYQFLKKYIGLKNVVFDFKIEANIPDKIEISETIKKRKPTNFESLNEKQKTAVNAMKEQLILKQYSQWTLKSYRNHLTALFSFYKNLSPEAIDSKNVQSYLLYQIRFKKISESTQNSIINAYKAYAEKVLKRPKEYIDIPRPKQPKKMPNVISTQEVIRLIKVPKNIKHKLALMLIYSAGLRKSELLNLRRGDINFERKAIFIKAGKGKKDRYVVLAETVIPYLKEYLKIHNPKRWLLEGQTGGQYSATSLQKIFESALEKSKINPYATIHTLRHSYATHCVENGHNLKSVQEALGHGSLKTTEIYLHISSQALKKLKSPLDNLDLDS